MGHLNRSQNWRWGEGLKISTYTSYSEFDSVHLLMFAILGFLTQLTPIANGKKLCSLLQ